MPEITKPVIIKAKPKPFKKKKTILLTFDDGPNRGTRKLMNIVKKEKIPVTLFVIGEHVFSSKEQRAMYDSVSHDCLFEIANHSFSHGFRNRFEKFYSIPDSVVKDFARCADSLNLTSNIIRTPGRNIWRTENISRTDLKASAIAADSLYSKGYRAMGWDLGWHFDSNNHIVQDTDEMLRQVDSLMKNNKTNTPGYIVVLAHDQEYASSDDSAALHQFMIRLKEKTEYDFETAKQYPGMMQ